jgi:hypothetical protein
MKVTGSKLASNTAKNGGAIFNDATANNLVVYNSDLVDNLATNSGGAISNFGTNTNVQNNNLLNNKDANGFSVVNTGSGSINVNNNWWGSNVDPNSLVDGATVNNWIIDSNSTIVIPSSKVGKTINITGVAKDGKGNPIAKTVIIVTVNGVSKKVTTSSTGKWTLSFKPYKAGNVHVSVSWTGNNSILGFVNSTFFTVKDANAPDDNDTDNNDTDNNDTDNNDTDDKDNNGSINMKKTGMPLIAIILFVLTIFGVFASRKPKK